MNIQLNLFDDKIEFYEATSLKSLEKKINEQIEHNRAIMLSVHSVSHQMYVDANGNKLYSAVVHYKRKQ